MYFVVLALAEILLSVLVSWKSAKPAQVITTIVVSVILLRAVWMLQMIYFDYAGATYLPFMLIGFCAPIVIAQLFLVEPSE
jgi:hypothetical protein